MECNARGAFCTLSNMSFGSWNIRGLNDPLKQGEVRRFLREKQLNFVGLVETRVKEINKVRVEKAIANGWNFLSNYRDAPNGRIWIGWDPQQITVTSIREGEQFIHCSVSDTNNTWQCVISVVYGVNCPEKRRDLWNELTSNALNATGVPWLGDFNAVRRRNEAIGGSSQWPPWKEDLETCMANSELEDLRFIGHFLTWSNIHIQTRYIVVIFITLA